MGQITNLFINLGQAIESAVSQGGQPLPPSGRKHAKDVRDYGARCDGVSDDSDAIQKALDDVPFPYAGGRTDDLNAEVYFPPLRMAISKMVRVSSPGTIVRGVGLCGGDNHQAQIACSTLVPLPGFQDPAAFGCSPEYVNSRWGLVGWNGIPEVRGVGVSNVCIDLNDAPKVTGFQLRSLSNCPEWRECSVIGGSGTGFDLATAQVPAGPCSLPCEGLVFRSCYVYGNVKRDGTYGNLQPTAPMLKVTSTNEFSWYDGKLLYCLVQPTADVPAVLINSEAVPRNPGIDPLINQGSSIKFVGLSTANSRVHYRLRGATINGSHYRPTNVTLRGCTLESFNVGVEAFQEPQEAGVDWLSWGCYGLNMDHSCIVKTPYGPNPMVAIVDHVVGGQMDFFDLGHAPGAGAKFGTDTQGVRIFSGLNPNNLGADPNLTDLGHNVVTTMPRRF